MARFYRSNIIRYTNITRAHPLWIFIFPHRNNPARRFNHAANLSACVLIRRFFLFDSNAGYKVTPISILLCVVDTQMDFVHGEYSRTPPYVRYVLLHRSSLSQSRNRDTRNTCQLARFIEILSSRESAWKILDRAIARSFLSDAAFPHNPSILITILNQRLI